MDLFGIFKKKKKDNSGRVSVGKLPKKSPDSGGRDRWKLNPQVDEGGRADNKYLVDKVTNGKITLRVRTNRFPTKYLPNTKYSPTEEYKKKLKMMADRAV